MALQNREIVSTLVNEDEVDPAVVQSLLSLTPSLTPKIRTSARTSKQKYLTEGLFCKFKKQKHCKYNDCQLVRLSGAGAGLGSVAHVIPKGATEPIVVPRVYVENMTYKVGDVVQVLDNRKAIPDQKNKYWYQAEIVCVMHAIDGLPYYKVKPNNSTHLYRVHHQSIRLHESWPNPKWT